MKNSRIRMGFTLVELLVSTVLILLIIQTATMAFNQAMIGMRRIHAVENMDSHAKAVFDKLSRSITAMHPGAAVWLRARTSPPSVELLFMHGKEENDDFRDFFNQAHPTTDYKWAIWRWTASARQVQQGSSSHIRSFHIEGNDPWWNKPWAGAEYPGRFYFFNMVPELRRNAWSLDGATYSSTQVLDENCWKTGKGGDIGDYTDASRRLIMALPNCSAFTIEMVLADGTTVTADGSNDIDWGASGSYVDGGSAGRYDDPPPAPIMPYTAAKRPCVIRLRATLDDPNTKASSTYCFSFAPPGFVKP